MTDRPENLGELQIELATLFFSLDESKDFLVAGGAALLASRLIDRPTEDLDLFAAAPTTSVAAAKDAFMRLAAGLGLEVRVVQDSPTFARIVVGRDGDETLLDLAIDSPPAVPPTATILGPTLAPKELAGRKLLALFGRAEARDFADVYLLRGRFGTEPLVAEARELDPGFTEAVLAQMLRTMSRFDDDEIPLPKSDLDDARSFFARWADRLDDGG